MRTAHLRARVFLLVVLCLVGGFVASLVITRAPSPPGDGLVFPAGEVVYGATLGQWSARHWQWTVSFPIGSNPGQDATGTSCGADQEGPVFFLPHNFPPCSVPADKIIYVPIVGTECSTAEPPPYHGETEDELRSCAVAEVDRYAGIIVRVDGVLVPDLSSHRISSPLFTLTLPENNVLGVSPGTAEAIADGYQLLLAPLAPGEHEILVHVELTDGTVLPDKVMQLSVVETGKG